MPAFFQAMANAGAGQLGQQFGVTLEDVQKDKADRAKMAERARAFRSPDETDPQVGEDAKKSGMDSISGMVAAFDRVMSPFFDQLSAAAPKELVIQEFNVQLPGFGNIFRMENLRIDIDGHAKADSPPVSAAKGA
jgi:hypothetical protein